MQQDDTTGATEGEGLSRRKVLGMLGAAMPLVGCMRGQPAVEGQRGTPIPIRPATPSCVVRPEQIEGPYFVDAKLNRSDIRSDPSSGTVTEGVPLRLEFRVSSIEEHACTPISGALVDVWQCDARGVYSGFEDINGFFDTRGQRFLRGYQVTDAGGTAQFVTIYPGWYEGRAVHIHFKIRTDPASEQGYEFTSQLYFDEAVTDVAHAHPLYAARGSHRVKNEEDFIYRRGGDQLMLHLTKGDEGYVGTFDVGLDIT